MIKLAVSLLLLSCLGCSSTSEKSYKKTDVESRADEYSLLGDKFRNEKKYQDALTYYQTSADLYLLKGSKEKYLLDQLKQCLVLLKMEMREEFNLLLSKVKTFNQLENLAMDKQISYMEARALYEKGNKAEANVIIQNLIKSYRDDEFEQMAYYQFFFASQNLSLLTEIEFRQLELSFEEIKKLYDSRKLQNIELMPFSAVTISQLYLGKGMMSVAFNHISLTDKIYLDLELTSKRDQVLQLYVDYYEKSSDSARATYYKDLLVKFHELMSKYN